MTCDIIYWYIGIYIYMYLWFNSFKNTSVPISLQGFGAGFVSQWKFIGPIWWLYHFSRLVGHMQAWYQTFLHWPGTRDSSLGAGATQFKSKKVDDQRFFVFEISNCSELNLRPNSRSFFFFFFFFFRDFLAFSPAGHSAAAHFVHRLLRSESSFQKHLQQKELGHQDLGYGSDGQTSSVVGGDFRQVFFEVPQIGILYIQRNQKNFCTFDL